MVNIRAGVHIWLRNIVIRTILGVLRLFSPSVDALIRRLRQSPGLPVPGPTQPYWTLPPSPLASHNSGSDVKLPSYADVVIIGSGITGTAFARTLLDRDDQRRGDSPPLQVVMLEARETCSGATGRNGGHITPVLYAEYSELKEKYGIQTAQKIMRFRLGHLPRILAVAAEEELSDQSQCREVEAFDVFHDAGLFNDAKDKLAAYKNDLPSESAQYKIYDDPKGHSDFQLTENAVGCMSTRAGAVHPYRLVTGILTRLLQCHNFNLFTNTPCIGITSPDEDQLYLVSTPKGVICTPHVIHATNGWAAHLLPGLKGKIIPARGTMTAQRPWAGLGQGAPLKTQWAGQRSFVFFPTAEPHNFDYLTQQLPRDGSNTNGTGIFPPSEGELMLGGGFVRHNAALTELGNADDRSSNKATGNYLAGALGDYFVGGNNRSEEKDRVKATWSGVLGISCDGNPWVGRVPSQVSGRCTIRTRTTRTITRTSLRSNVKEVHPGSDTASGLQLQSTGSDRLSTPGEWMAAGYTGEGMVHAWRSGEALAMMVLGMDEPSTDQETMKTDADVEGIGEWFPDVFRVTEDRWNNTGFEDFIAAFL